MADWVTDMPTVPYSPLVEDFSVTDSYIAPDSNDMQAGNTRLRNWFSVDIQTEVVKIQMGSANTVYTFLTWVRDELHRGADKFTMPVPFGDSFAVRTVQIVGGGKGIAYFPNGQLNGVKQYRVEFTRRVEDYLGLTEAPVDPN